MARSASVQLFKIKNYFNLCQRVSRNRLTFNIVPIRFLRGSRYRNDNNEEETKFQKLLKSIRNDEKLPEAPVFHENEAPVFHKSISASIQENVDESNSLNVSDHGSPEFTTPEDLVKKLEEKFAPLQKEPIYTRQLERKYKKCLGDLRTFGERLKAWKVPIAMGDQRLPCPVDLMLPSPLIENYRNKDEFSIGLGLDGNDKTVGFFLDAPSEFSTTFCICPKELCIVRENHIKFAEDFQNFIRLSSLPASQHFTDKGNWKNLVVRSNDAGDMMGIVVMHPQDLTKKELQTEKEKLKEYFSNTDKSRYNLTSLYFQSCRQSRCTHEKSPFELILGVPSIVEEINNIKLHVSPDSFFYTNTKASEAMYNSLLKLCRVNNSTTILDIFCGPGAVSLLFSPRVKRCFGIDDSIQAIGDAKLNCELNASPNVEFIHDCAEYGIRDVLGNNYHEDVLAVINPSRNAINKSVITTLREYKSLKKIIYISNKPRAALDNFVHLCKPTGTARNLGKPFLPILALPVDFYPQTNRYGLILMFQRL